ncbi:MAG: hypothetical protein L6Q60_02830 [Rhodocyclaceae bacterium]|nr:hypothetical protein [Rhodocyclaceae bacterium]
MKKIILGSVLAVAAATSMNAQAAATAICTGGAAQSASVASGTNFIKNQFNARCSNNIMLVGEDLQNVYQAGGASTKGKSRFGASTAGGGITGVPCASATGCISADAVTEAGAALTS